MATYRGVEIENSFGVISVMLDGKAFICASSKDARWLIRVYGLALRYTPWIRKDDFDIEVKGTRLERDFILSYGTRDNPLDNPVVVHETMISHEEENPEE